MKHELLEQGAFAQMEREQALKEIVSERFTTNEKQNVYASKKYNVNTMKNKQKIITRQHEYENRLIAIEEEIRALNDKKIYLNECIETLENDNYILKEQIINK